MAVYEHPLYFTQVLMYINIQEHIGRSSFTHSIPHNNGEDHKKKACTQPDFNSSLHNICLHTSSQGYFSAFPCLLRSGNKSLSWYGKKIPMCPLTQLIEVCIKTGCHGGGSHLWDATFSVALLGTSLFIFTAIWKHHKCSLIRLFLHTKGEKLVWLHFTFEVKCLQINIVDM